MMCEICGKKVATVHWTEMVNNAVKKMHLCEACAAAKGLDVNNPKVFSDILLGLGTQKEARQRKDASCAFCHMRLSDLKKTSRLGCQACYDTFADELKHLQEAVQKGHQHVGKVPSHSPAGASRLPSLAVLCRKLDEAIAAEKYEAAAELRDQISNLTEKSAAKRPR